MSKDVGLRIRVEADLRKAFQDACSAEKRSASAVLREYMRVFSERRSDGMQADLFSAPAASTARRSPDDEST